MNDSITLSVILPAYLEEDNLRLLLPRLRDTLERLVDRYEILVVDTHTALDNTQAVCEQHHALYINREQGNFFGDAVRTGIARARGAHIIFMDADGSHPPEFIARLYQHRDDADVVIASRYIDGGYTENSRLLVLMSKVVNVIFSVVLNLDCKDVSNSFKLYRADLLKGLKLYCNNFDVVEEILVKIKRIHPDVRIREIPFSFKKRMFGHTKRNLVAFIISFFITLIKLRFRK